MRVPSSDDARTFRFEGDGFRRQTLTRGRIIERDARAFVHAQTRRSDAASTKTNHEDATISKHHVRHLSFMDARLTSARRMEMIQKRTMILGSGHPFFS